MEHLPVLFRSGLPSSQGGDAVGAAARHRSVGSLGTQPPRRSEAPNQGRVICAAVSHRRCISHQPVPLLDISHGTCTAGFGGTVYFARGCEWTPSRAWPSSALARIRSGFHGSYSLLRVASPRLRVDCFWADCSSRRQGAEYSAQRNAWLLSNVHLRLRCAVHLELSRAAAGSEANLSAGVARVENLVDTVSKTGFKGTPAFMSPEQLQVPAGSRAVT